MLIPLALLTTPEWLLLGLGWEGQPANEFERHFTFSLVYFFCYMSLVAGGGLIKECMIEHPRGVWRFDSSGVEYRPLTGGIAVLKWHEITRVQNMLRFILEGPNGRIRIVMNFLPRSIRQSIQERLEAGLQATFSLDRPQPPGRFRFFFDILKLYGLAILFIPGIVLFLFDAMLFQVPPIVSGFILFLGFLVAEYLRDRSDRRANRGRNAGWLERSETSTSPDVIRDGNS
jgi:hypothetical protein